MTYVKWVFRLLVLTVIAGLLHYGLPQRDIVRVVNTYEERQDLSGWTTMFWAAPDNKTASLVNRDVLFIQAIQANGAPMVYRNEDTGWGWPPYFKFDTATLQTEAADAISDKANPDWYAITHYGWRNEFMSIFPNATRVEPVSGPEVQLVPWFNIIFLTVLGVLLLILWRLWVGFREANIDPLLTDAEDAWDAVDAKTDRAKAKVAGVWRRLFRR